MPVPMCLPQMPINSPLVHAYIQQCASSVVRVSEHGASGYLCVAHSLRMPVQDVIKMVKQTLLDGAFHKVFASIPSRRLNEAAVACEAKAKCLEDIVYDEASDTWRAEQGAWFDDCIATAVAYAQACVLWIIATSESHTPPSPTVTMYVHAYGSDIGSSATPFLVRMVTVDVFVLCRFKRTGDRLIRSLFDAHGNPKRPPSGVIGLLQSSTHFDALKWQADGMRNADHVSTHYLCAD